MDVCIPLFIVALFTVAEGWKQTKCPIMGEQINKMWSLHTVEYYTPLKRMKILSCSMTEMNLKICNHRRKNAI